MSREDDIRREQARKRLQARLERNGTADAYEITSRASTPSATERAERAERRRARQAQRDAEEKSMPSTLDFEREQRRAPRTERRPAAAADKASPLDGIREGALGLLANYGWKAVAIAGAIVVVVLILVIMGIRGCVAGPSDSQTSSNSAQAANASASASSAEASEASEEVDETPIDEKALEAILGEYTDQLLAQAESDNDAHWIAAHPDEYLKIDGNIVQFKMLRLAALEPASLPFVRAWPEKYCADDPDYSDNPSAETFNGIPRLYQWDKRWGYTEYSSTTFALTGCCPTALAMVYQGLTGKDDMSPYEIGKFAEENGFATEYNGTDASLLLNGAPELGLKCTDIGIDSSALKESLEAGHPVIINVGPGDFTDSGHYFVATGLSDDGQLEINDPFSAVRSDQTWDIDQVIGQSRGLYAFEAA